MGSPVIEIDNIAHIEDIEDIDMEIDDIDDIHKDIGDEDEVV